MPTLKFAVLAGDYIGPEVMTEALRVLQHVAQQDGLTLDYTAADVGGAGIDNHGQALPESTLKVCAAADAILFGSVGGPKWDNPNASVRPEQALFALRTRFNLFANLRPVSILPELIGSSPLKAERLQGVDMLVVRELTGGLYFGRPKKQWVTAHGRRAVDTMAYSEQEIERIVRVGKRCGGRLSSKRGFQCRHEICRPK